MISVQNHFTIMLVEPDESDLLPFADWVAEHCDQEGDVQFWGDALVVEPRYVSDVIDALQGEGFEVSFG